MRIRKLRGGIHLVEFDSQYMSCMTFMRMQEYYESPLTAFRGHFFTVEEFMDAYAKEYDNFTYAADWEGFNVPGHIVVRFFQLFSGDLTRKERRLHELVLPIIEKHGDRFYLIGVKSGKNDAVRHETAHGLYYLNPEYRAEMDAVTQEWAWTKKFHTRLLQHGYAKPVLDDETQAYMATSTMRYLTKNFKWRRFWGIPPEYGKILRRFSN